jgi:hypothetical protein
VRNARRVNLWFNFVFMAENRRIVVNLEQPAQPASAPVSAPLDQNQTLKPKRSGWKKILLISGGLLALILLVAAVGGYWWWSNLQKSPTYSLALLIDGARKDDQKTIDQFLDTNQVVDNFVPQIETKAKERYARGLTPETVKRAETLIVQYLTPVLPTIKEQARLEIPRQIKEKAANVPQAPAWSLAFALNRIAEVTQSGDKATIKSNYQNRPLEVTMQKNADKWKVVGFQDEPLADRIAQEIADMVQQELSKKPNQTNRLPNRQAIEELRRALEQLTP